MDNFSVPSSLKHPNVFSTMAPCSTYYKSRNAGVSSLSILYRLSLPLLVVLFYSPANSVASKIYISPWMQSWHFDQEAGFNNENYGLGFQIDLEDAHSLNIGAFKNSEYHWSRYVSRTWYPLELKKIKVGILAGIFDGYEKESNGGWFLAMMPVFTLSREGYAVNVTAVPSYEDRIRGAIVLQVLLAIN